MTARVYWDTSLIPACVSTRSDAASQYRRATSNEWLLLVAPLHDLFVSIEVLAEPGHPSHPQPEAALRIAEELDVLQITPEVAGLATRCMSRRAASTGLSSS